MKSGAPPISKNIRLFSVVRSGNGGGTCVFRDLTLLPKLILFPRRYCQLQISKKIGQRDVVVFTKDGYRIDGQRAFSAFCTTDVHSGVHRYAHLRQPSDFAQIFQLLCEGIVEPYVCPRRTHVVANKCGPSTKFTYRSVYLLNYLLIFVLGYFNELQKLCYLCD